jgi:hypothetical protein
VRSTVKRIFRVNILISGICYCSSRLTSYTTSDTCPPACESQMVGRIMNDEAGKMKMVQSCNVVSSIYKA